MRRWLVLGCGWLACLLVALPAAASTFDCKRFLALDLETRQLYTWALVEGGIAVRASYQADAIQLAKDGDQENADGSNFVARAIAEKLRPALHRAPGALTEAIEARCASHKPTRSITLVFLETIDEWRREGPQAAAGPAGSTGSISRGSPSRGSARP